VLVQAFVRTLPQPDVTSASCGAAGGGRIDDAIRKAASAIIFDAS